MTDHEPHGAGLDGVQTPDRSWLRHSSEPMERSTIAAWIEETDRRYAHAREDLHSSASARRSRFAEPGIGVVIPAEQGHSHLGRCLHSLARQSLAPELFEVVVVLSGDVGGARETLDRFREAYPSIRLRTIQLSSVGQPRARNAGIAAVSRDYTTFIDAGDYVSPSFLEVLLANADPAVVPVATVVDVDADGLSVADEKCDTRDLRENRPPATDIAAVTAFNGAKAVPSELIKDHPFSLELTSGADVLFWASVAVRGHVAFVACPTAAIYYRSARSNAAPPPATDLESVVASSLAVIARLEELAAGSDSKDAELIRTPIGAQTALIGELLRQHPADHRRVVAALDRAPIFTLPYERLNTNPAKSLAIAFAFPPYADTSAIVTAKRIRGKGEIVDVIHNAMDSIRGTDNGSRRIAGPFVSRAASLATPSYFQSWGAMEQFSVEGLKVVREWESAGMRYESLYSRAHFAASHFLAAAYKLSNPGARWIAEFSDPLSRDVSDRERGGRMRPGRFLGGLRKGMENLGLPVPDSLNCLVWCEEITYVLADELVFTNENQMDHMLGYCSNPDVATIARAKAVISPHPTLPREFYSMVDHRCQLADDVVHLGYFGNFYANRGLDDVLTALAKSEPSTQARLRIHVFTTKPAELGRRAAELGLSQTVRVRPYVGYLEFLNLTTKFDCLIVNDAVTRDSHPRNPYLPSKWADYKGSGRPVWGLVEPGSPLSRQPLDFVSPVGDVEAARDVLSLLANS